MLINSVMNQRVYPEAGDIDDCWIVATVMAAKASRPSIDIPTVTIFRFFAGDPDDGYRDGGTLAEIAAGVRGLWPELAPSVSYLYGGSWNRFEELLRAGGIASLAVDSSKLPPGVRYGFNGLHQITVFMEGNYFYIANPLAPEGSTPQLIGAASLRASAYAYSASGNSLFAAIFPSPTAETHVYRFDLERWLINGDPARPVTTIGVPLQADGTPDWSRRLAYVSDRGGANPRLILLARENLVGANNAAIDESLTKAIGVYAIPPDEATLLRIQNIKNKIAAVAADIGND